MDNNRKQIRLSKKDQAAYGRGLNFLKVRNPFVEPSESDVLRTALNIAFGSENIICPHCDMEMIELKDSEGGTLGIWHCPECADGNGEVVIKT